MKKTLRELLVPQAKSKIKAGDGLQEGKYKFFTCSPIQNKFYDEATFTCPSLIFGTGGNASVHYCNEPFSTSTDCLVMYGTVGANLELIYQYLHTNLHILQAGFKGAGLQHISKDYILDIDIDLPDEEMQTHITNQIREIDNMIVYRNQQLSIYDNLVKSRFIEMFGDPVTNPKGWAKRKHSDECDIVTGNTPSRKIPEYYGDYIEWIKSDNINTPSEILTSAEEYLSQSGLEVGRYVDAGAILMTCIAGSIGCIGNVAIADRKVSFNQQINGIIPKANNTWFMYVLFELTKKEIQSSINMALKGILSKGQLSEMEFIFPPIDLQNEFATFVEQTDKLKFDSINCLKNLLKIHLYEV